MLCAKEIKSLTEAGTALGFKGDELWEFVNRPRPTERLRIQKEKENNVQIERENKERVRETEGKRD